MFTLNNGVVNWKSSKHELTIDSTLEVEYISASEAAKEAVWIRKFTAKLEVVPSANVLKTRPVIEPEKLPVHGSLVRPVVEPLLNR